MAKGDKLPAAEIVAAAQALEDELLQLEAISRSAQKIQLNSEKTLARATTELQALLALPDRLQERLHAVVTALNQMQTRQQAALDPLTEIAAQIQERSQLLQAHMESYAALGKATAEANALLEANSGQSGALIDVEKKLEEISEGARALFEAARTDDFPEVAREADVLKQRMAALRKRLPRLN
ncbi:MAG TPA: hypothetical protein VHO25_03265 [Polyangiaceae bacterium]|nr:hypothetical protein [Polyangiaceae bacterium]